MVNMSFVLYAFYHNLSILVRKKRNIRKIPAEVHSTKYLISTLQNSKGNENEKNLRNCYGKRNLRRPDD